MSQEKELSVIGQFGKINSDESGKTLPVLLEIDRKLGLLLNFIERFDAFGLPAERGSSEP